MINILVKKKFHCSSVGHIWKKFSCTSFGHVWKHFFIYKNLLFLSFFFFLFFCLKASVFFFRSFLMKFNHVRFISLAFCEIYYSRKHIHFLERKSITNQFNFLTFYLCCNNFRFAANWLFWLPSLCVFFSEKNTIPKRLKFFRRRIPLQ